MTAAYPDRPGFPFEAPSKLNLWKPSGGETTWRDRGFLKKGGVAEEGWSEKARKPKI